jgi:hypothetical protein
MDFPSLKGSIEEVKLKDHSLQRLKLLQGCCTNMTTVEVSLSVMQIRALDGLTGESQQLMKEALSQINSQLQAIPSLKTIIVRITGSNPAFLTLECMRTMGWTVLPIELPTLCYIFVQSRRCHDCFVSAAWSKVSTICSHIQSRPIPAACLWCSRDENRLIYADPLELSDLS